MTDLSATAETRGTSSALSYIPFVDGLRAISVLAVVAYHVGVPYVTGGFVGVDVFFIISGFLIIGQIVEGLQRGTFSFADFWSRRAIRILPPYLLVIVTCIAVAPLLLLTPEEYRAFGDQVVYSAAMVVNHLFLDQQGYFDASSDTKILLHLWSLAVEEQFYLFAPVILFGLYAFLKRGGFGKTSISVVVVGLLAAFSASFVLCVLFTDPDKNYAFYLMPLRGWEFILGGAIPFLLRFAERLPGIAKELLGLVGLALVAYAIFFFTDETPFPSFYAAIPAVGASLVIFAGLAHPKAQFVRVMSLWPMVAIGLVSYSWYLWHWPLLAFARIYNFGDHLLVWDGAMGILSLFLAIHTHLWIERPLRNWRRRSKSLSGWKAPSWGLLACAHVVFAGFVLAYMTAPRVGMQASTAGSLAALAPVPTTCRLDAMSDVKDCLKLAAGRPVGLVMGDSHAKAAFPALYRRGEAAGLAVANLPLNGCAPFFNVAKYRASGIRQSCEQAQANGQKWLASGQFPLQFGVLVGQWDFHRSGLAYKVGEPPASDQRKIFIEKLRETVKAMQDAGAQRVLVIGNVPLFGNDPGECLARSIKYQIAPEAHCAITRKDFTNRRARAMGWVRQSLGGMKNVKLIDPLDVFCDASLCRSFRGNETLYTDYSHVNDIGADLIYAAFPEEMDWLFGKPSAAKTASTR